jgi:hypothetical protein
VSEAHASPDPGTASEAHPPVIQRRTARLTIIRASLVVGIIGTTIILNRLLQHGAHGSDQQPEQTKTANVVQNQPPIQAPALRRLEEPSERNRAADRIPKSAKSTPVKTRKPFSGAPEENARVEEETASEDTAVSTTFVASDVMRVADAVTSASTAASAPPPVTITGCLEISADGDEFRLADTQGDDAPKSRGWRTGFLTTRRVPVTLVEPPESLGLKSNVGKRVAATGLLLSRNLKVSALRVVDPSCD